MGLSKIFPSVVERVPNQYVRAVIVLLVLFLVLRLLLALFEKFFMKFTTKTKTDIDDILLTKSAAPLNLLALVLSVRIAFGEIVLSQIAELNIERIIYSALIIAIGYMVYTFVDVALVAAWEGVAKKSRIKTNESLTNLVQGALRVILIVLAIIYILEVWGVEIVPVLGALGIAGLAVALALQPTLSNIFSGISLIMDKSVRVGDRVILDENSWGVIEKIGIRSTRVNTSDNETVIIPNTKLADSNIRNASLPEPKVRRVAKFGVAYGSDVEKVKKIILAELKKISWVVREPEPVVRLMELGESSLNFKAYFYIEGYEHRDVAIDEVNTRIYNALNNAGLVIPLPQMDVHLKKD
jgi:MscS family membrane protein